MAQGWIPQCVHDRCVQSAPSSRFCHADPRPLHERFATPNAFTCPREYLRRLEPREHPLHERVSRRPFTSAFGNADVGLCALFQPYGHLGRVQLRAYARIFQARRRVRRRARWVEEVGIECVRTLRFYIPASFQFGSVIARVWTVSIHNATLNKEACDAAKEKGWLMSTYDTRPVRVLARHGSSPDRSALWRRPARAQQEVALKPCHSVIAT